MELNEFIERALLVPFKEKGRDYDGWDCWGLLRKGLEEVWGIEVPSYADEYGSTARREELAKLIAHRKTHSWSEVETAQPGDGALLKMMGRSCHVGLMIDDRKMLHVEAGMNTAVEDTHREPWKTDQYTKVLGIYRHARMF